MTFVLRFLVCASLSVSVSAARAAEAARTPNPADESPQVQAGTAVNSVPTSQSPVSWSSPARLKHGFGSARGALSVSTGAIEFRPEKGLPQRWAYGEIKSLDLGAHRLRLTSYVNRGWHRPGDRTYSFELRDTLTPDVAGELARRVGKPVQNRLPAPSAAASATLEARHTTRTGGSHGLLRFTERGIDYVTVTPGDSRAWRWSDLRTVSAADPYHLLVFGFLDTFSFELKSPISRELVERVTDQIFAHNFPPRETEAAQ